MAVYCCLQWFCAFSAVPLLRFLSIHSPQPRTIRVHQALYRTVCLNLNRWRGCNPLIPPASCNTGVCVQRGFRSSAAFLARRSLSRRLSPSPLLSQPAPPSLSSSTLCISSGKHRFRPFASDPSQCSAPSRDAPRRTHPTHAQHTWQCDSDPPVDRHSIAQLQQRSRAGCISRRRGAQTRPLLQR